MQYHLSGEFTITGKVCLSLPSLSPPPSTPS
jgi:hypothetical protein